MTAGAVLFTLYNRPEYLAPVLESWLHVRGLQDWTFQFRFEPSSRLREVGDLVDRFVSLTGVKSDLVVNTSRLGVLLCPWMGFEDLFTRHDFVVRAEDDLIVSDDVLEYLDHCRRTYADDAGVGAVCAASTKSGDPAGLRREVSFNPLIWGTWRDRWLDPIGPTWDKDYSTFNGVPGNEAGWDWNLSTRVFPSRGLSTIYPWSSRVHNIGVHGTHSTDENHVWLTSFRPDYGSVDYVEERGSTSHN